MEYAEFFGETSIISADFDAAALKLRGASPDRIMSAEVRKFQARERGMAVGMSGMG